MKYFTHPPLAYSFIRYKDGSSYSKYWRYLRPTVILEGGQKNWDEKSFQIRRSASKPHKLIASLHQLFKVFPQNVNALNSMHIPNSTNSFWA